MNSFHFELKFFDYIVKLSIDRSITMTITNDDGWKYSKCTWFMIK